MEERRGKALWQLCQQGDLEGVKAALARGENVNGVDGLNQTGLMLALERGHNSVVHELLHESTIAVNNCNSRCDTALHFASASDNVTGLRMLLGAQAPGPRLTSVQTQGYLGHTPLMRAVMVGKMECVRELVSVEGVDLETRDDEGRSLEEMAR